MAATSTYLDIVNNTIDESGAELATFLTTGADFTTNTNVLMQRIRRYVSRAWKDIQITAYDWKFMAEQGLVELDPGIMFFTDGQPVSLFALLSNTTINILDQDATTAIPLLPVTSFYDLTSTATLTEPYGYFNITGTTTSTPISIALKPGAEYFTSTGTVITFTNLTLTQLPTDFTANYTIKHGVLTFDGLKGPYVTPDGTGTYTATFSAVGNQVASMTAITGIYTIVDTSTGLVVYLGGNATTHPITSTYVVGAKAYIHSWKSFDFDEETQTDDFQENIQEINQQSFRAIDYYKGPPSGESPLDFVAWQPFEKDYDISNAYPGFPRIITNDNTGRWKFYPAPYYRFTLKFDYVRKPQIFDGYLDIPRGIEEEFVDAIMWKALIYYGEFDEQPSVAERAKKNFKDYMFRLELKYRDKFRLVPKRLY